MPVFKLEAPGVSALTVTLSYDETRELVLYLQERMQGIMQGTVRSASPDEVTVLSHFIVQICDVVRETGD